MIKIGVTGGIGSGKSVVSDIFRLYGAPVYDADREAKILNDTSPSIRERLSSQFGKDIYADGKLDRKKLASIIFHDSRKLAIANSIIHPELARHFAEWCDQRLHHPIVILDAALLVEAGFYRLVDKVIAVYAPTALRIERVMRRERATRSDVKARMDSQLPEEEKIKYADYVIYNDNKRSLITQVSEIINDITRN